MSEYLLETKDLKKPYVTKKGTADAVKGISFHVKKGEIFGFLGANGAGKIHHDQHADHTASPERRQHHL